MSEPFEVGGHTYRAGKLDAFRQFHVVRRMAPVLSSFSEITRAASAAQSGDPAAIIEAVSPLLNVVAQMPDDHVNYVLGTCLSICQRKMPGDTGWARVWNADAQRPQFDDIDMMVMVQIVAMVLSAELSGFFRGLPSTSSAMAATG